MKTLKIIVGLILGLASLFVITEMIQEESGAGLVGALTGFAVLISISVFLIYSGTKTDSPKVVEDKSKLDTSISDLKDLKEKGILTESEYKEKVAKIKTEQTQKNIENSLEYKQLKGLLNSGILTKEEFESKVDRLQKNNNFQTIQFNESNILGLYIVDGIKYKFDSKSKLTVTNKRGTIFNERWYLQPNNIIKVKVGLFTTTFKDIEIDKDGFSYTNSKTRYYAKRTL